MNIILLSGGSGKRLWPLSGETRSKQFLKILRAPSGTPESMVMRVFRQINEAEINAKVTIIAGETQKHFLRKQLGDTCDIVSEPCRRDTFPAIALACAYLHWEKKLSDDEPIIVLPVDPYVDLGYFQTLATLEKTLNTENAKLVLMGIKPTYPSEKYGYILPFPGVKNSALKVEKFIEKPSLEAARQLIAKGAFWNGGVFAFKLGWLMSIVKENGCFQNFADLKNRYAELEKISFDYHVVEKTSPILMIPYYGTWKDLGTWNTLSEEMKNLYSGKVIAGEGTESTHIINELSIPLVALGVKDMAIVATPDGILVTDKACSSYMKPYVDKILQRPMYEERSWGEYRVLDYDSYTNDVKSLTKHLYIRAGEAISYQRHILRDEIWTIVDGTGDLVLDGHVRNVQRGDVAYISAKTKHAIRANTDLHFIEVQIGTNLIEEDIERFSYEWR